MEKFIQLKNGMKMPRLGMDTWLMGDNKYNAHEERVALKAGINAGMTLIDTAEYYRYTERMVGRVIKDYSREEVFIISKVYPHNADEKHMEYCVDRTLRNLKTDYLDLHLLHGRGNVPLAETVACMERLVASGKIRNWGVSNFDLEDMEELFAIPGGEHCAADEVVYHLGSRGVEYDLLPWLRDRQVPLIAYCPLAQAGQLNERLLIDPLLHNLARKHGTSIFQVMLAFVLHQDNVAAVPRSRQLNHVLENSQALDWDLEEQEFAMLDREFPAPRQHTYLDIV